MKFQPGQSGNPNGRPKGFATFRQRCAQFMDKEGFSLLTEMAREPNEFALRLMAEYAYGKPQQHVDLTSGGESLIKPVLNADFELLELPSGDRQSA